MDAYSDMCQPLIYESLLTISQFITILHHYQKDLLADKTLQELLLQDILSTYTVYLNFEHSRRCEGKHISEKSILI